MKGLVLFVSLSAFTVSFAATSTSPGSKPAWQWTIDERLTARNDPAAAAERVRSGKRLSPSMTEVNLPMPDAVDYLSGKDHPELFMPWELFDYMAGMAYADKPEVRSIFREAKTPLIEANGLPADFWTRLEGMATGYLSATRQIRDLHKSTPRAVAVQQRIASQTAALQNLKCRDRAAAIVAARREFGSNFDRFLYQAIAPSMTITIGPEGRISGAREHEIERGCQ